jgi:hypothetical protein
MRVADFVAKWRSAHLTECAAAQSHFRDLCDLLGEEAPTDADPKGEAMIHAFPVRRVTKQDAE